MTVVNPKSISGINSITTASGADNLLTIHTNNTTERIRINNDGDVIVGSGITVSPDGDIFTTGVCTATSFSGDGSSLTGIAATDNVRTGILDVAGIATFRDEVQIITDNKRLKFGAGNDLNLYSTGTNGWVFTPQSGADLYMGTNAGEIYLQTGASGNDTALKVVSDGAVELYHDASKKIETTSYGALVSGELQATGANFTDDGQSSPVVSVLTDDNNPWGLQVSNSTYSDNAQYGWNLYVNNSGQVFNYNIGVNSYNDWNWYLSNSSASKLHMKFSGAALSVELYNDNNKKFSTTSNGIEVHGSTDSARIEFGDAYSNSRIGYFGLNRFGIDGHDGLEVRDPSDSYAIRMKIDENGRFNVNAGGSFAFQTAHHCIQNSNATSWAMQAVNTASLGYGVEIRVNAATASREALYVYSTADSQSKASILSNGTFNSRSNTYGSLSDVKLKENIVDANSQWDDLKAVKVRNFNFISDTSNTKLLGVVAQELETVCPSLIETINDKEINEQGERVETGTSTKSVKYSILYMKAIKTLQEAQTRIEVLETRLNNAGIAT